MTDLFVKEFVNLFDEICKDSSNDKKSLQILKSLANKNGNYYSGKTFEELIKDVDLISSVLKNRNRNEIVEILKRAIAKP